MTNKQFKKKLSRIKKRGERQRQLKELRDAYAQYMPEKRERKVSNIMLVVVVVGILAYTIANLWITYATGAAIDSTLTTCFYAFWGSELLALTTLKTAKILKRPKDECTTCGGALDQTQCE